MHQSGPPLTGSAGESAPGHRPHKFATGAQTAFFVMHSSTRGKGRGGGEVCYLV